MRSKPTLEPGGVLAVRHQTLLLLLLVLAGSRVVSDHVETQPDVPQPCSARMTPVKVWIDDDGILLLLLLTMLLHVFFSGSKDSKLKKGEQMSIDASGAADCSSHTSQWAPKGGQHSQFLWLARVRPTLAAQQKLLLLLS